MYDKGFYISGEISNNAFSYDKRRGGGIYVAPLIDGSFKDVAPGSETVFEDFDDDGKLKSCRGLKNFVKLNDAGDKSVYVFDNHNHAFYFWHLERILGRVKDGALLIHIDQHKDSRRPAKWLTPEESRDMEKVFDYANTILNVGNFVPAALETGLAGRIVNVGSAESLRNFDYSLLENPNKIVDLDLDFFAPELDYIGNGAKAEFAAKCIRRAGVVTIATSPFFIDQDAATRHLAKILELAQVL
jgi:hypothetical protein